MLESRAAAGMYVGVPPPGQPYFGFRSMRARRLAHEDAGNAANPTESTSPTAEGVGRPAARRQAEAEEAAAHPDPARPRGARRDIHDLRDDDGGRARAAVARGPRAAPGRQALGDVRRRRPAAR